MKSMDDVSREAFNDWAREEDKKVFVDYADPRVKTNETLYGKGISRSDSVLYSTKDRITHLGFNSISDFDIAIREVKNQIKDYDTLLNEYQDRIDEIDIKLRNKNPEHDKIGAIPKLNNALEENLKIMDDLITKLEKEKTNLMELEAARKEFLSNKKSTYKNQTKDRLSTLDELSRAEKELKALEGKIYAGTANELEKERYSVLKDEIIPEFNDMLSMRGKQFEKADDTQENVEENIEENVDALENSASSNDDSNSENDEEKDKDKEQGEDVVKKANLDPEKPKKVKFLSKAKEKLVNIIDGKAAKAVMAAAGFIAAIVLVVTNPALLALVPAAKIAYDYNQGRKL